MHFHLRSEQNTATRHIRPHPSISNQPHVVSSTSHPSQPKRTKKRSKLAHSTRRIITAQTHIRQCASLSERGSDYGPGSHPRDAGHEALSALSNALAARGEITRSERSLSPAHQGRDVYRCTRGAAPRDHRIGAKHWNRSASWRPVVALHAEMMRARVLPAFLLSLFRCSLYNGFGIDWDEWVVWDFSVDGVCVYKWRRRRDNWIAVTEVYGCWVTAVIEAVFVRFWEVVG